MCKEEVQIWGRGLVAEPSLARDLVEYLPLLSAAALPPRPRILAAATVNATTESSRGNDSGAIFS